LETDTKLRIYSYKELARKLERAGYIRIRTSIHPVYYSEKYGMTVPVPTHSGDVPKGLLRKIIKEMGMSVREFNTL